MCGVRTLASGGVDAKSESEAKEKNPKTKKRVKKKARNASKERGKKEPAAYKCEGSNKPDAGGLFAPYVRNLNSFAYVRSRPRRELVELLCGEI